MRTIDADALKADFRLNFGSVHDAVIACQIVDRQPTLTPQNEPMTIEQLREMDGEPVWVSYSDDGALHGFWALVGAHRCWLVGLTHSRGWSNYKIAVRDWDAKFYRRPPEGEADA